LVDLFESYDDAGTCEHHVFAPLDHSYLFDVF